MVWLAVVEAAVTLAVDPDGDTRVTGLDSGVDMEAAGKGDCEGSVAAGGVVVAAGSGVLVVLGRASPVDMVAAVDRAAREDSCAAANCPKTASNRLLAVLAVALAPNRDRPPPATPLWRVGRINWNKACSYEGVLIYGSLVVP